MKIGKRRQAVQEINGGSLDLCRKNSVAGSKPNDLKGEILGNTLIMRASIVDLAPILRCTFTTIFPLA